MGIYPSYGCSELISDVRNEVGREEDTVLITEEWVMMHLNKAQEEIAERCLGLHALEIKNTTSVDFTEQLSWSLSEFTSSIDDSTSVNRICHVRQLFYLDGNESVRLDFMPLNDFDDRFPDPTHTDSETGIPKYWTRRGNTIEIYPLSSCAYCDNDMKLTGSVYPPDFTAVDSTMATSLERADDGLVHYAVWEAWKKIGGDKGKTNAVFAKSAWEGWLAEYRERNDLLHEWDANVYGEWL